MALAGKSATLGLDLLNKTSFEKAKKLIRGLIKLGKAVEKTSFALGVGVVVYDANQAYKQRQDYVRVILNGSVGFGVSAYLSSIGSLSAWGTSVVTILGGDAAVGGLFFVTSPFIGTFVVAVIGLAAIGTIGYGVTKAVEAAYDSQTGKEIAIIVKDLFDQISSAWKSGEKWLLDFYGVNPHAQ